MNNELIDVKKTCLYAKHLEHNAKMVEFGGFLMPIEYTGLILEHESVRNNVGLFDVSHMGEIFVSGIDTMKFLNHIITSNIKDAPVNKMTYGLLLYTDGGVVDDLMLYKYSNELVLIVCNASNTTKDFAWIIQNSHGFDIKIDNKSDEYGQLALQGPNAIRIMSLICDKEINELKLFDFREMKCNNREMLISRSGYTGEDGFEIYSNHKDIIELFDLFVNTYQVTLCGLGCRDTLRFEASMPLYGHEIDKDINPVEACLNYAICLDKDFIGKASLLEYKNNQTRKLVGIELIDRGIARSGYELVDLETNDIIGYVTTGYLIPHTSSSLVTNPVAMGFVKIEYIQLGTQIGVKIRRNVCKAIVRDRKFMQKKYVK